jgi:hypothetical protein
MPLSVAKMLKLRLAEDDPVVSYWLRLTDERICEALILTRREGGSILCLPQEANAFELIAKAEEEGFRGLFGPWMDVTIRGSARMDADTVEDADGDDVNEKLFLSVMLVDVTNKIARYLGIQAPPPSEDVVYFKGTERDGGPGEMTRSRPCAVSLQVALDSWLTKYSESVQADLYITAEEADAAGAEPAAGEGAAAPPSGTRGSTDPMRTVSAQLTLMMEKVAALEKRIPAPPPMVPQEARGSADAAPLKKLGGSAKSKALAVVGKAPVTRLPKGKGVALPLVEPVPEELGTDGDEDDPEEAEGVATPGEAGNVDDLLRAFLLKQFEKPVARVKKTNRWLPQHLMQESDGSDEEASAGPALAGARGSEAAEDLKAARLRLPGAFADAMEARLLVAIDEDSMDDSSVNKFARDCIPIGRQKTLGYMVWLLCYIHRALRQKKFDKARLLSLTGLMMSEQHCLDNNWKTAWELTDLPDPPFQDWLTQDVPAIASTRPKSLLAEQRWVAAITAKAKDDKVLYDRRTAAKGGGKHDRTKEKDDKVDKS